MRSVCNKERILYLKCYLKLRKLLCFEKSQKICQCVGFEE